MNQETKNFGTKPKNGNSKPTVVYHPEAHYEIFPTGRDFISWMGVGISGFICLFVALTGHYILNPGLKVGDIADRNLVAPYATMVVDEQLTKQATEKARQSLLPVFNVDASREQSTLAKLSQLMAEIEKMQAAGVKPMQPRVAPAAILEYTQAPDTAAPPAAETSSLASAETKPPAGSSTVPKQQLKSPKQTTGPPAAIHVVAKSSPETLRALKQTLKNYVSAHPETTREQILIALSVAPENWTSYKAELDRRVHKMNAGFPRYPVRDKKEWKSTVVEFLPESWSPDLLENSALLVSSILEPNIVIDPQATQQKAKEAAATVKPIMRQINAGDLIVPKGSVITKEFLEVLESVGITEVNQWPMIFSLTLSLAAAMLLVFLFLYTFEPKHLFATHSIALMFTLTVITTTVASAIGKTYPQFVPLPAVALIFVIFFGRRVAVALTAPLLILMSVDRMVDITHLIALGTASGGAIGTYSKHRNALMFTGLIVGVMQALGYLAASAMGQNAHSLASLGSGMGTEMLGGVASAIIAIGSLPFLENIFGMITPFRLAEITDADQPLLRKLEENAPGTYQHSLAVANLGEAGARAIGANVNLVRAGALYHDIGKMVRPKFFIENQLGATNPHDSMRPEDSRDRVLAHVTDGIALAQKYSLPKAVQDFIPMHQGTSLMAYFYHKACVRDGAENVDQGFYRYPGPKPQSKETAIVMLADVSEAVTHSMKDPSEQEVDEAMDRVFQNRWDDGQFDESSLTYEELQRVKQGFVRVWRTLHHDRLKYPSTTTGKMAVPPPAATEGDASAAASAPSAEQAMAADAKPTATTSTDAAPAKKAEPEIFPSCCEAEYMPATNGDETPATPNGGETTTAQTPQAQPTPPAQQPKSSKTKHSKS